MIFYFSATGNSLHAAKCISREGERLISITEAVQKKQFDYMVTDDRVGIVSPTYAWTLPNIVSFFLKKLTLSFEGKPYLFYLATCGTSSGASVLMADELMEKKGLSFDALYDVIMPDTWTPIFDLSDKEAVAEMNDKADLTLAALAEMIDRKVTGKHTATSTPVFTGRIGKLIYDRQMSKTKGFAVDAGCIGCGLCERKCPVKAIEMFEGKPVWVKEHCVMCLGCLHRCPKFAISRGSNTKKHGQYLHR